MIKPKFKIGDKVRILNGSEIDDYTGGFPSDMARLVGKVATVRSVEPWPGGRIAYLLEGPKNVGGYSWDERGLELVGDAREQVVIYRCGRSVFAKDLMTHRIAEAKCSPEDKFDFYKGAALALDRLFDREGPKQEEPKYYNGQVVCVERGPGKLGALEETGTYWWTVGKVYDVVNGVIRDNDGDHRSPVKTLEELNELEDKYAKFIALADQKPEEPKYYNGKVVCVEKSLPCWFWTPGKVYEIKDGVILDDDGDPRRNIRSVDALNALAYGSAEFVALVE